MKKATTWIGIWVAAIVGLVGTTFAQSATAPTASTRPFDSKDSAIRNRYHVAYIAHKDQKSWVVVDGQDGGEYDAIEALTFSPDGKDVAYQAEKNGNWLVVVDGREGAACDEIDSESLIFSPDGRHTAHVGRKGTKQIVVMDNHAGKEYDDINSPYPIFSPDSQHVAYTGKKGDKWVVVVDDQESALFDKIDGFSDGEFPYLVFSSDSNCIAYSGETDGQSLIVAHRLTSGDFKAPGNIGLPVPGYLNVGFSSDGKHIALISTDNDRKASVILDGKAGPAYDWISALSLVFSPDGKHFAYAATKGEKRIVVLDGKEGPAYDDIAHGLPMVTRPGKVPREYHGIYNFNGRPTFIPAPVFSPDSQHIAYVACRGTKGMVILDGQAGAEYDDIGELIFSPDSKHLNYEATNGERRSIVEDVP